jgi:hypothetical protein
MLSLASLQSFLWPPALFPMTLLRAVVEAAVSGVEAFMAVVSMAGLAAPTSEAAPCVVVDTLTCPVPLLADRSRARRQLVGSIAARRIAA